MTAAEEAEARFRQLALTSTVRVHRGQVPVGKGEKRETAGCLGGRADVPSRQAAALG